MCPVCREGAGEGQTMCSSLQTAARGLANRGGSQFTFCANTLRVRLTITAYEPTFRANSLQTAF
jgi:hypothetical protein